MPRLEATVTVQTTIKLTPKQRVQLRKAIKLNAEQAKQIKELKKALAKSNADAEAIRALTGAKTLEFEGWKITRSGGNTKFFNKEQFARKGGDLALYNECIEEKPKKEHTKITAPGEKEEAEDE